MTTPLISVVVPTRDRPDRLARLLLACIKNQSFHRFECLVIDDGSNDETLSKYDGIWKTLDDRFVLHRRATGDRGSGPGRARNIGIELARGIYIAFCDDDDAWVRDDHLSAAAAALSKYEADLFFANLQTSNCGEIVTPDWFWVAENRLRRNPLAGETNLFQVSREDMSRLLAHRCLHADTLVVSKTLLAEIGMYCDSVQFAEDHDFSFRLADAARKILFRSVICADLDVSHHPSAARRYDEQERILFSILACLRAELQVVNPRLRRTARSNRAWRMLELARLMIEAGRRRTSCELAAQAMLIRPSLEALRIIARALRSGQP